ncbi:universal stress protein [Thermodesulfobacteriota bacterium]
MVQEDMACPMTRGERILVAVDGSRYSDIIVDQAISMGRVCNSVIIAICVVELFAQTIALAPDLEEQMSNEARETLEEIKRKVEAENLTCETVVRIDGHAHRPIVQEAKGRGVDLIVMGTHGKARLKNSLMGSVTQKVIGNAPCAVMVVPV